MTLCMALVCQEEKKSRMVLCLDSRLDEVAGSSDTANKFDLLGHDWFSLISGDDWLMAKELSRFIYDQVSKAEKPERRDAIFSLIKHATSDFQSSPFCIVGRRVDLIAGGFIHEEPMLIYTGYDGSGPYTTLAGDMAVVGSGAQIAITLLKLRAYGPQISERGAVYLAYEAKKYSENAPSVGPKTAVIVLRPDGTSKTFPRSFYKRLEQSRVAFGLQPINPEALPDPRSPKDAEPAPPPSPELREESGES